MSSKLNPYINFKDNARQAMEFYQSVFGGELHMMTFKESNASQNPSDDNKIMHSELHAANDMTLMASDAPVGMPLDEGSNISISLSGDDEAQLKGYWDKLASGAKIIESLQQAPWGDTFGMLTDRFGVTWLVNIAGKRA